MNNKIIISFAITEIAANLILRRILQIVFKLPIPITLTENMRSKDQNEYNKFLLEIGNG